MDIASAELEGGADRVPTYSLHPLRGVVWAAFWGTPIAAGIVLAINYWRLGNTSAARKSILIGVVATAALIAVSFVIPDGIGIPDIVFCGIQLWVVYWIASYVQGVAISHHARRGGNIASAWQSVGIGLLCSPVAVMAIVGISLLADPSWGSVVKVGKDEVYYAGNTTEVEARKLAYDLRDLGYFGSEGASVKYETNSTGNAISFVLVDDAWNDSETTEAFRTIGEALIDSGHPSPLRIQLCDDYLKVHKTVVVE